MRPSDEMKHAFPQPDERFRACVRRVLDDLLENERRQPAMKPTRSPKLRIGVILACAVLLSTIAMGAAALRHNLFDFLDSYQGEVLPEAEELLQTDIPQQGGQTEPVTFRVREALYDGVSANLLVEAVPADDTILIVPPDSGPDFPVSDLGLPGSETIGEYAAANGKTEIWAVSMFEFSVADGHASMDFAAEAESNNLLIYFSGNFDDDSGVLPLSLQCTATRFTPDGSFDEGSVLRSELNLELTNTVNAQHERFTLGTAVKNAGVTVEHIDFTSTELGLYYTIAYRVTDQATFDALDGGLDFRFLDETGAIIPGSPAASGGSSSLAPNADGLYIQEGALTAHETIPASFTLSAVSIWQDKQTLDTFTFTR